jgi:hypothetical protein
MKNTMKDLMQEHEDSKSKLTAEFTNDGNGVGVSVKVNASGDELRALIGSLALKICEQEEISVTSFFAEIALMVMLQQQKGKKDED